MLALMMPVVGLVLMLALQWLEDWLVRTAGGDVRVPAARLAGGPPAGG